VNVAINGEPREVPPGTTVEQLVRQVTDQETGIAAALNGEVLPRRCWPATPLTDHDQVEVVTAVQGG
jgi:sulfur carrier protein